MQNLARFPSLAGPLQHPDAQPGSARCPTPGTDPPIATLPRPQRVSSEQVMNHGARGPHHPVRMLRVLDPEGTQVVVTAPQGSRRSSYPSAAPGSSPPTPAGVGRSGQSVRVWMLERRSGTDSAYRGHHAQQSAPVPSRRDDHPVGQRLRCNRGAGGSDDDALAHGLPFNPDGRRIPMAVAGCVPAPSDPRFLH